MTALDPADRRPSGTPLPPALAELDAEFDAALAEIRAAELAAAVAYASLPWWRRRLYDYRDWRWRRKFRRRLGRGPYPTTR
jgi:hypothetical protein